MHVYALIIYNCTYYYIHKYFLSIRATRKSVTGFSPTLLKSSVYNPYWVAFGHCLGQYVYFST